MNGHLPNDGADIHPWMPLQMHGFRAGLTKGEVIESGLGKACNALGISIHDREKVYAEMQRVQKEINFKTA